MRKPGDRLRLAQHGGPGVRVECIVAGEEFDGDCAIKEVVRRFPYDRHAADAKDLVQAVTPTEDLQRKHVAESADPGRSPHPLAAQTVPCGQLRVHSADSQ